MSKKHFESLASNIRANLDSIRNSARWTEGEKGVALISAENVARAVAGVCADANPRFDTHRFLAACGIN
jgi:hypothetical protein